MLYYSLSFHGVVSKAAFLIAAKYSVNAEQQVCCYTGCYVAVVRRLHKDNDNQMQCLLLARSSSRWVHSGMRQWGHLCLCHKTQPYVSVLTCLSVVVPCCCCCCCCCRLPPALSLASPAPAAAAAAAAAPVLLAPLLLRSLPEHLPAASAAKVKHFLPNMARAHAAPAPGRALRMVGGRQLARAARGRTLVASCAQTMSAETRHMLLLQSGRLTVDRLLS
jgi:hypothetical protein